MMLRLAPLALSGTALLTAACGGKVYVDPPSSSTGGAGGGGTTTTTTITTTTTVTTTTTTTSTTTTTTTGTVTGTCGGTVVSDNADCQSCVDGACCSELAACAPGTPCGQLLACVDACKPGDGGCVMDCEAKSGAGAGDLQALIGCAQQGSCGMGPCLTPICDSDLQTLGPFCGPCLSSKCCAEVKACKDDMKCFSCIATDKPPPDCNMVATFNALLDCFQTTCGLLCQ